MNRDVFILSNGRLKRKDNTLYFVNEEGLSKPLPIEQTDTLHLFGQVDFNSSALHLLTLHGVRLHVYNYYGYYDGSYLPRSDRISGYTVLNQCAHVLDHDKRMYLAKAFLEGGIHHMQRNLRKHGGDMTVYADTLVSMIPKLMQAETIPELMGVEGQCRQIYYEYFPSMLKGGIKWEYRSKRPPHDPANALISFGNGLIYATILSELHKTVLDPAVSFLHQSSSKRYSLCLDLAEIFKPLIVDPLVFNLVNNRRIQEKHFELKDGIVFLNAEGRQRFLSAYDEKMKSTFKHRKLNRNVSYRYLIRLEAYKLIKHLIGDEIYKPFKAWW